MRGAGHIVCMVGMINAHKTLIGRLEGKRPLRRPMCRWEDNIRLDLEEKGWEVVD
jgi:hypothetical protein